MFEKSEELQEAIDKVYGLMSGLRRGDVLRHEQIGEVLGLDPADTPPKLCRDRARYYDIVWGARFRLKRERKVACWTVEGVGYELLTPARQVESALWHNEKAMRSTGRGRRDAEMVPDTLLTPHQRRVKAFYCERSAETRRALLTATRVMRLQLKPTPTVPRRPRPPEVEDRPRA